MRTLSLGHSPDADDLFMYYAIAFGWVSHPALYLKSCGIAIERRTKNG